LETRGLMRPGRGGRQGVFKGNRGTRKRRRVAPSIRKSSITDKNRRIKVIRGGEGKARPEKEKRNDVQKNRLGRSKKKKKG